LTATPHLRSASRRTAACFVVRDRNGQVLAHVYFEDESGRRSAAELLTKDKARRIAAKFARLPELLHPILANSNSQHC
jgi:hypothetical protein